MRQASPRRPHYLRSFWAELGRMGGEHDAFIKVIIVERIVKAIVLIALAIGLMVAGEKRLLTTWAQYAQDQLNLDADHGLIVHLLLRVLLVVRSFTPVNGVPLPP